MSQPTKIHLDLSSGVQFEPSSTAWCSSGFPREEAAESTCTCVFCTMAQQSNGQLQALWWASGPWGAGTVGNKDRKELGFFPERFIVNLDLQAPAENRKEWDCGERYEEGRGVKFIESPV